MNAKTLANSFQKYVLVFTLLFWLAPFLFYGWGRLSDRLPSSQHEWGMEMNHGPWGMQQPQELIMMFLFSLLPCSAVITLLSSVALGIWSNKISTITKGVLLVSIQLALAFSQIWFLFWTID
jgi:hypothetical protein